MVASARWDALGTWCEVLTVDDEDLPGLADLARTRVAALERACSGGGGGCELDGLATGRPQPVSPLLALVLAAALRTAAFTDGLVDPVVPADGAPARVTGDHATPSPSPPPGWRGIVLNPGNRTVTVPDGVRLDVAAAARAWAADWIAAACAEELGAGCLVNLGGDIAVQGQVPEGGWQIEIDDGHAGPQGRPVISMGWPGGLATASTLRPSRGAATPSLPDPATVPRYWRTVTVAGRSCERAHAGSAAAILLGDAAPRWLSQRELPARLVHTGGVVVQTNGWPQQRWIA